MTGAEEPNTDEVTDTVSSEITYPDLPFFEAMNDAVIRNNELDHRNKPASDFGPWDYQRTGITETIYTEFISPENTHVGSDICLTSSELESLTNPYYLTEEQQDAFITPVNSALNIGEVPDPIYSYIRTPQKVPRAPLYRINNVALYGPDAVAVTSDQQYLLPDMACERMHLTNGILNAIVDYHTNPDPYVNETHISTAVSLIGFGDDHYYHWFIDHLPRLRGFDCYKQHTGITPTILIPENITEWAEYTLKLLGYWEYTEPYPGGTVNVQTFVLPHTGFTREQSRYLQTEQIQWIRERVLNAAPPEPLTLSELPTKILISRQGSASPNRQFSNIDGLRDALPGEFEIVQPEQFSIPEQIQLFQNAEVVIGAHGAALTNILWGDDLRVIEIFGASEMPTVYCQLAGAVGHEYACFKYPEDDDGIHVDAAELTSFLSQSEWVTDT